MKNVVIIILLVIQILLFVKGYSEYKHEQWDSCFLYMIICAFMIVPSYFVRNFKP